jgi:hypothetical protein
MIRVRVLTLVAIIALSRPGLAGPSLAVLQATPSEIGPFELTIGRTLSGTYGQQLEVSVDLLNRGATWPVAGFNFLIQYDAGALVFQKATAGTFLSDCAWEYFSYRLGATDDCGADHCPPGVLRIVALADQTDGNPADHPDCYTNDGVIGEGGGSSTSTELARLTFQIMDDPDVGCTFAPVRFLWNECGDNVLTSAIGETQLISRQVYDFSGNDGFDEPVFIDITGLDNALPTLTGAPSPECETNPVYDNVRGIDCYDGGVDIICTDSAWNRIGDINCNGRKFEVADAIMYANYFLYGLSAFGSHIDCSISAGDVNHDGRWGTLADVVVLIRIVIGDVNPYDKAAPIVPATVRFAVEDGVVSILGDCDISGAALVVRGSVTPELLATDMEMAYRYDGAVTRILVVSPLEAASMHSFRGAFIGGISGEIVSLEMATSQGVAVTARSVPVRFSLSQNYPNPFNPMTTIAFSLPTAADYRLTIYNVEGRLVDEFQGRADAPGGHYVEWNAGDRASGVYLYRLDAGRFSQTRKMLLLK